MMEKLVSVSYYCSCKGLYFDIFISQFYILFVRKACPTAGSWWILLLD